MLGGKSAICLTNRLLRTCPVAHLAEQVGVPRQLGVQLSRLGSGNDIVNRVRSVLRIRRAATRV
jgi:hypothetical protein